jgi:hypothetical protein
MKNSIKNYKESMKKINNLENKFILIQLYAGFGNKIFDIIIGLYLKINFGYNIYYVDTTSAHIKSTDPKIKDIFQKLSNEFIFISDEEGDYIQHVLKYKLFNPKNINNLQQLNNHFTINQIKLRTTALYHLVFDMYNTFDSSIKNLFDINQNLILDDILSYTKTNYAIIHIRYGDKLNLAIDKDNLIYKDNFDFNKGFNFISFPIYTPDYYYKQILQIKKLKLPIIILTDSVDIVKYFIINKYNLENDPDIFIPNINFINSFYLMLYSNFTVMSHSTFSYSSYLLSKNLNKKEKTYIFCYTKEFLTKYKPIDLIISNNWKLIDDKKYILNFNQKLVNEMNKYKLDNESTKKI